MLNALYMYEFLNKLLSFHFLFWVWEKNWTANWTKLISLNNNNINISWTRFYILLGLCVMMLMNKRWNYVQCSFHCYWWHVHIEKTNEIQTRFYNQRKIPLHTKLKMLISIDFDIELNAKRASCHWLVIRRLHRDFITNRILSI